MRVVCCGALAKKRSMHINQFRDDLFAGQVIVDRRGQRYRALHRLNWPRSGGVVITGRQEAKLADVAVEISVDGGAVDTLAFDIRDEDAVKASVGEILSARPSMVCQQCGWPVPSTA